MSAFDPQMVAGGDLVAQAAVAARTLFARGNSENWTGYDPYDALNSRILQALPFLDFKLPRLALIQLLKRSPINIRPLLLVPKTQNAKAVALVLKAAIRTPDLASQSHTEMTASLIGKLVAGRSPDCGYWCWGYSFPWQTRTLLVPRAAPNLVCTTFVAGALLDAYEAGIDSGCLDMAVSAAEYLLRDLYWTSGRDVASFSYPAPSFKTPIHNANLLAAALLCRVHKLTGEQTFLAPALRVTRYAMSCQHEDGSWPYGEGAAQGWIDNFHTGYNLCALDQVGRHADTAEFETNLRRGFEFYRRHFFLENGTPKYFHDRTYPIDIHCVAQSIITLLELRRLDADGVDLAQSVCKWAMDHMWDQRGFFYYRSLRFGTIRTSYVRWAQAWMVLALATLVDDTDPARTRHAPQPMTISA